MENYLQEDKTEEDVFLTIQKYKDQLLALSFDCGLSDTQIGYNRILHQQSLDQNIPHDYEEYQGSHECLIGKNILQMRYYFLRGILNS